MKFLKLLILTLLFSAGNSDVFGQHDYVISINGKTQPIALGKEYTINVNGQSVKVSVIGKDTLTHLNDFYSFQYPKDFKPNTIEIDQGIEQLSIMNGDGTGFIIQKYKYMNPTSLNEMMLQEVTKESISYGFKMDKKISEKKLKSGQQIKVTKAILTYKDQTNVYEIASYGKKDEGIIVMTMMMDKEANKSGNFIDLLWKSLSLK